jgi:translation initiation factor IF-3
LKSYSLSWRIDNQIRAPEVRVIGKDGKQLGVLKTAEALSKAKEAKLSLVEIAPRAQPPVVKITDYSKFRYQEEKKYREQQKKVKGGELKETRFSPFIADNDYNTRLKRVREFLAGRNKVRLVVVFTGRQMGSKPFGYNLLDRIVRELGETITVDMQPKFLGKHLMMVISPVVKNKSK